MKKNIEYLGKVAVFYIPSEKNTDSIRQELHDFFVSKHNAYTHEASEIIGYWTDNNCIIEDKHERYEVSIRKKEMSSLIDFISNLCEKINEKSIYLTIGNKSYLVSKKNT
jgi:hypothetical protein